MPRSRRPADWPPNMTVRNLSDGRAAYYWVVPTKDKRKGCTLANEALGGHYGPAIERARILNALLTAWRNGGETPSGAAVGTVDWLADQFEKSPAFKRLSERTKRGYSAGLSLIRERVRPQSKQRWGTVPLAAIRPRNADELFERLAEREGGLPRWSTAAAAIRAIRAAWNAVRRDWPDIVPSDNPFAGVRLRQTGQDVRPAALAELDAFVAAANEAGHPSVALAALVCWHWLQRPDHVRTALMWSHLEETRVRILHPKTGSEVFQPRIDPETEDPLFPEIEAQIAVTPKRGPQMIMRDERDHWRGEFLPYEETLLARVVREVRDAAKLPADLTLRNFRKGGMTEAGDAGATDAEIMASSAHKTRGVLTVYTRRTSDQALSLARKRRAHRQTKRKAGTKTADGSK